MAQSRELQGPDPSPRRSRRRPLTYKGVELHCTRRFENEARAQGFRTVAGTDEVGRGALCGPVVACVVVLGETFDDHGLDDSKRLTRRQREIHAARIREGSLAWALGAAEAPEIDHLNILRATHLAVRRALEGLSVSPDLVLVDGREISDLDVAQRAIVKGDALSVSIAAASIVAKVARDEMMRDWDRSCPGYGLARNKGYASQAHREALRRLGPSQIHRRTFRGTEPWLF